MILPEHQIKRYMRHIIMPEISGPGQRKLLESSVMVIGSSVESAAPLLYYLSSSGIGKIYFSFDNDSNATPTIENLLDLNPDIEIESTDKQNLKNVSVKIILGNKTFINRVLKKTASFKSDNFIPVLVALQDSWSGIIHLIPNQEEMNFTLDLFKNDLLPNFSDFIEKNLYNAGITISSCFNGALSSIEAIKLCLNLGSFPQYPLSFDLFNMSFAKQQNLDALPSSNISSKNSTPTKDISKARVLIVGTGGLGSPVAYALTSTGIGTIGILDSDSVELSNLNRQILHSTSRIGIPKVKSAEIFLKQLNPDVNITMYDTRLTSANVEKIIEDFDMVVSAVDNLKTRYILNDACHFAKKPLAEAGVLRFDGLGFTIVPGKGPCYRCLFPQTPSSGEMPSCSETGILGPVPGVMGFIQAAETVKVLSGIGKTLEDRILLYDALETEFRMPSLNKNPECPLCGHSPSINSVEEYDFDCEVKNVDM
jgi:molybdopterin/thiamine biosynthesis adenylyltransferase